jgi:hypothetical protein
VVRTNAALRVSTWDKADQIGRRNLLVCEEGMRQTLQIDPLVSDPLQAPIDPFGSARPFDATRIASAALSDANAGDLRIQTP